MQSACGRYVITYNGEVYNYRELTRNLEERGHQFRGGSDTEVILAAISEWGVEKAVSKLAGMFAFGLWDREEQQLSLCRDRLGIKPLYVGLDRGTLVFASELKPFREVQGFDLTVDRNSLTLLLRHNCIPAPHSIFCRVRKLLPGHLLKVRATDLQASELPRSQPFWEAKATVESRGGGRFEGSPEDAIDALDGHLRDAVKLQMIADVPIGAFLSGGIDSSTVVAMMQAQSIRPVKTFTIGLLDTGFNEATHAKAVARHLGTDHTELYITPRQAQEVIPMLPALYDEPFSDSSQIPTCLASKLARQQVTVSLSGDGGDELFAGYNRYGIGNRAWSRLARMPPIVRRFAHQALTSLTEQQWDRTASVVMPALPERMRLRMPGYRAHRLAETIRCVQPEQMYRTLVSHWKDPERVVIGGTEPVTNLTEPTAQLSEELTDFRERMMYSDFVSYLPDDILTKVDRASMGVGLETRVPLIDHRVVEFAWSLPMDYKIRYGKAKWVLRRVLEKYVPVTLFDRPKMGFGIPIGDWLRSDLRDWGEELLNEGRLKREGFFVARPIRELWENHLSGRCDWGYHLWDVLMFQAWLAGRK